VRFSVLCNDFLIVGTVTLWQKFDVVYEKNKPKTETKIICETKITLVVTSDALFACDGVVYGYYNDLLC